MRSLARRRSTQRGTTLLEALIAFAVLSLGILTIGRVQTHLRLGSDIARQRSEAVRLGQEELETLRAYSVIAASAGARSYAEIDSRTITIAAATGYATNTQYRLTRDVQASAMLDAKQIAIDVAWADRSGADQHVRLSSWIAGSDPLYAAALAIAPGSKPLKGAFGRATAIPVSAKNLGDGRSALKRLGAPTTAIVFDNSNGFVTQTCSGLDPGTATADLTLAALTSCDTVLAYLLSGTVRFSLATPPDPAQAHDTPLPTALNAASSGGSYAIAPSCTDEPLKTVAYSSNGVAHLDAVPIGATPASLGLASWVDSGDRYIGYQCLIYPLANGQWSGDTTLVPTGWAVGTTAPALRICRYASDLDGSGAIDANAEHPAHYSGLSTSLGNQNFLVVTGSQSCPTGSLSPSNTGSGSVYANFSTVQHQP